MDTRSRLGAILAILSRAYPHRGPFVQWHNPLELVVGTMLSAQCTDVRVNQVMPELFARFPDAEALAHASLADLERIVRPTGFFRVKARYAQGIGRAIIHEFKGQVPGKLKDLVQLPGISYKSAYLILSKIYDIHAGVAVDTHVMRLAQRWGLTRARDQQGISRALSKLVVPQQYLELNELCIMHGRAVCRARLPQCGICSIAHLCLYPKKSSHTSRT